MAFRALRRAEGGAHDAQHDRRDGDVLAPPAVLVQQPLPEQQQHEQPGRERRLHDDQRGEQQREHLQRPAHDRQARAGQPADPGQQVARQGHPEVLAMGGALGVHRLEGDP